MFIERLPTDNRYSSSEATIHVGRYFSAKHFCWGKSVLDVACGEGYGTYLMADKWGAKEVCGVDVSPEAIARAKQNFAHSNVSYLCGNAKNLTELLGGKKFDLIVSFETIEHVDEPEIFLESLKQVSHDDTVIIISCPNDHWYYPEADQCNPFHMRKFTFAEFAALCESRLGRATEYLIGLPCDGYANIRLHSSALYEEPGSMKSMLRFSEEHCLLLPSDSSLSPSVASYFVGIWNVGMEIIQNTAAIHSSSMNNSRVSDYQTVVKLREQLNTVTKERDELQQWAGDLTAELQAIKASHTEELETIKAENNHLVLENVDLISRSAMLESEHHKLLNDLSQLNTHVMSLSNENERHTMSSHAFAKEHEFLRHNLWLLQNELRNIRGEYESLVNSTSWRLTAPLRKAKTALKRMMGVTGK